MTDPTPPGGAPQKPSDAPSKGDAIALGIGCLVFVILIAAAMFYGFTRDG
jgi:hypothetical protein